VTARKTIVGFLRENDAEGLESYLASNDLPELEPEEKWFAKGMKIGVGIKLLNILLDAGADPHELPPRGCRSPLERAIDLGRLDYLKFLLDQKVDPNANLEQFRVPLAVGLSDINSQTKIEMFKLLLEHGVDLNFQYTLYGDTNDLFTLMDHSSGDETLEEYLRSVGAKPLQELMGEDGATSNKANDHLAEVRDHMDKRFGPSESLSTFNLLNAATGISIHIIKPSAGQDFSVLYTVGMSSNPMNVPSDMSEHAFGELFMMLPLEWDYENDEETSSWPVQLLFDMANYPQESGGYFGVPVTAVVNGDPPEALGPGTEFDATALIANKDFLRSDGQTVHLFCAVPIYADEASLARDNIPKFLSALDATGTGGVYTPGREKFA